MPEVPPPVVARLAAICLALPEAREEQAWTGVRWRVRTKTFAHVAVIEDGWPPVYARAAGTDGPAIVLTFRSSGPELVALRNSGPPFWAPPWRADDVGMFLDGVDDWDEVAELLTDSYCVLAPRKLSDQVVRPEP